MLAFALFFEFFLSILFLRAFRILLTKWKALIFRQLRVWKLWIVVRWAFWNGKFFSIVNPILSISEVISLTHVLVDLIRWTTFAIYRVYISQDEWWVVSKAYVNHPLLWTIKKTTFWTIKKICLYFSSETDFHLLWINNKIWFGDLHIEIIWGLDAFFFKKMVKKKSLDCTTIARVNHPLLL